MPECGLPHCAIAARQSPRDFTEAANFSSRGLCHFIAGRLDDAVEWGAAGCGYHGIVREKDRATYIDGLRAAGLT
jgi:hypothetical protein